MKNDNKDYLVRNHLPALKMTELEYVRWCRANGFSMSLNKSFQQMKTERDLFTKVKAEAALKNSSQIPSIGKALRVMAQGKKLERAVVVQGREMDACKPNFAKFLMAVEERSDLLDTVAYVPKLQAVFEWRGEWLRKPEDWSTNTHNRDKQFSQLVRFLLTKYDVPAFMDAAWDTGDAHLTEQFWYVHMGMGENIRTASDLPIPLTKAMAHHFSQAPDDYSIDGAFLWAEVHSEKGDARLARALLGTHVARDREHHDFRKATIRFFVANPMLDTEKIGPICDYVWNQKYLAGEPEQPGFAYTGRSVETLLNQVEAWHHKLGKVKKSGDRSWSHMTSVSDFEFVEGMGKTEKVWRIKQILTSAELLDEGKNMRHCVFSYATSCAKGTTSIWVLTMQDKTGNWRQLTMEVRNKMITQMRGYCNRSAEPKEVAVVRRWTSKYGIALATYL